MAIKITIESNLECSLPISMIRSEEESLPREQYDAAHFKMILTACHDFKVLAGKGLLKKWRAAVLDDAETEDEQETEAEKEQKLAEEEVLRSRRVELLQALIKIVEDAAEALN